MTLEVFRDGRPGRPEGVVSCDVELAEDCHALAELGEHADWTDEQFHELVTSDEYGWGFDARHRRYLCPPCRVHDAQRSRPPVLAGEGFPAPFGTTPQRRERGAATTNG